MRGGGWVYVGGGERRVCLSIDRERPTHREPREWVIAVRACTHLRVIPISMGTKFRVPQIAQGEVHGRQIVREKKQDESPQTNVGVAVPHTTSAPAPTTTTPPSPPRTTPHLPQLHTTSPCTIMMSPNDAEVPYPARTAARRIRRLRRRRRCPSPGGRWCQCETAAREHSPGSRCGTSGSR